LEGQDDLFTQDKIESLLKKFPFQLLKIYPNSFRRAGALHYVLIRCPEGKRLAIVGEREKLVEDPFRGEIFSGRPGLKLCDLSLENTRCLMELFPFTRPVALRHVPFTFGTGDRLGNATPGHLKAVRKFEIRPVLAQQSVRENKQTGRTYPEVIADAAWGVFQEGYEEGYGADGDHLKSLEELGEALRAGVSMVTLDLSEVLDLGAFELSSEELDRAFDDVVDRGDQEVLFHLFLDKEFRFRGAQGPFSLGFDKETIKRNLLLYHRALDLTEAFRQSIDSWTNHRPLIDFEISIDETTFPTSPESHLFFVIQLQHRGIHFDSLAPRFVGEFQKGIDYIGDLHEFRVQFDRHAAVARDRGGYKLSIHSGSDKFSAFPIMGGHSEGLLHVKTAGTSWLEAVRLVALMAPSLYREMHEYALRVFEEASKLYHVTAEPGRIPRLQDLPDEKLPELLNQRDSRQLLHITYGFLLNARFPDGKDRFRRRFYEVLDRYEETYWDLLAVHMERHLDLLGARKKP